MTFCFVAVVSLKHNGLTAVTLKRNIEKTEPKCKFYITPFFRAVKLFYIHFINFLGLFVIVSGA